MTLTQKIILGFQTAAWAALAYFYIVHTSEIAGISLIMVTLAINHDHQNRRLDRIEAKLDKGTRPVRLYADLSPLEKGYLEGINLGKTKTEWP